MLLHDPFPKEGYIEAPIVRDKNIIAVKEAAFIDFAIEVCEIIL